MDLATQRRVTQQFINVRPENLVLTPRTKTQQPSGGFTWVDGIPRAAQTFTFIEPGSMPLPDVTLDGVERRVEFELLGRWDAAIAVHDTFTHQGKTWEVVALFYHNGYETRALVAGRG